MSTRAWLAFAAVAVLWGIPYFLMKVALVDVSPAIVAFSRLALGALILLPLAWRRGALGPAWKRLPWILFIAVEYLAIPWLLIPLGEVYISSSLAAIVVAGLPLTVTVLSLRRERPHALQLLGLLGGVIGVAVMVGIDVGGRAGELFGVACMIVVTVCYAVASIVISRKLSDLDQLGPLSLALAISAALELLPAALTLPNHAPGLPAVLALLALGAFCTATAMALFFFLIGSAGPARATVVSYINPLVAVLLGVVVLGERFTVVTAGGGALVLAGSWLATRKAGLRRQPSPPPAAASTTP